LKGLFFVRAKTQIERKGLNKPLKIESKDGQTDKRTDRRTRKPLNLIKSPWSLEKAFKKILIVSVE
jgi:hypothetical protein